ncbi:MAG: HAMP domain-containing protein [Burkholderiales bacterium]|nr:HAMP domain-containing protein [Burkholderiales bacterium]
MPRPQARIGTLIYGGVAMLVAVVFWLALERHMVLGAIEDDFARLQRVASAGRVAADLSARLAGLSGAIREYVAGESIEPPARITAASTQLMASIRTAEGELPGERAAIRELGAEAERYLASFHAVATARRLRQERLNQLALAAGGLRAAAIAGGRQAAYMLLREAEIAYLSFRRPAMADEVARCLAGLAQALRSREAIELAAAYDLAFARVVEIHAILERGTGRVLDEHDARLREMAQAIGRRAQAGEGEAAGSFGATLARAIGRNVAVFLFATLVAVGCAFLLVRHVIAPINRMTGTMTAIARGDHGRAIPFTARADEIGQMARSLSTFRNAMLELRAAQAQAEAASRHKSDFIAHMSHELRTPLNAIIGLTDMLLEDAEAPDPRELKESLPRIAAAARHLLAVINEILDLSQIEAGRMAVELALLNPASIAEESLATVAPMAREKGLELAAVYPDGLPAFEGDARRVRQILINLLGNAVKFTDAGQVRLEVSADARQVRFAVVDTGPGIAQEDLGRLFREFTQLDASSTRKYGGSGLGLALSRRMARLMGGEVSVASRVGTGSTFVLELPLHAPESTSAQDMQGAGAGAGSETGNESRTV